MKMLIFFVPYLIQTAWIRRKGEKKKEKKEEKKRKGIWQVTNPQYCLIWHMEKHPPEVSNTEMFQLCFALPTLTLHTLNMY